MIIPEIKVDAHLRVIMILELGLTVDTHLKEKELTTGGLFSESTLLFWATFRQATKSIKVMCLYSDAADSRPGS